MATTTIRVLIVDDFEPFRRFVRSLLQKTLAPRSIIEASDGAEALSLAEELQPNLILLDVGLPTLNGIEAAKRMREVAPQSKILFVSQESSPDVVAGALAVGAAGYLAKTDAGTELIIGVNAVLRGEKFISRKLSGHGSNENERSTIE